jgi:hypothetical protein
VQLDPLLLEQLGELLGRARDAQADDDAARREDADRRAGAVAAE